MSNFQGFEFDAAINSPMGFAFWNDSQHYHYDHHDYHVFDPQTLFDLINDGHDTSDQSIRNSQHMEQSTLLYDNGCNHTQHNYAPTDGLLSLSQAIHFQQPDMMMDQKMQYSLSNGANMHNFDHAMNHEIEQYEVNQIQPLPIDQSRHQQLLFHQDDRVFHHPSRFTIPSGVIGIPGNPKLPVAQSEFFSKVNLMSSSSSDSDDDLNPPFVTALPKNTVSNHSQNISTVESNHSSNSKSSNKPAYHSSTLTKSVSKSKLKRPPDHKLSTNGTSAATPSSTTTINHVSKDVSSPPILGIVYTPMFKSTRDENGKYHETRKNCVICRKRINTFCRDCGTALCFGDGKDPNQVTCWERYHNQNNSRNQNVVREVAGTDDGKG